MSADAVAVGTLLKRIGAAPDPERLTLRGLCPRDGCQLATAWEGLIDRDMIQRVVERCGVWWYRLTDKGRVAVAAGRLGAEAEYGGEGPGRPKAVAYTRKRRGRGKNWRSAVGPA